jgi:TRAP-type C4-dicarboxylate transport system permease small subunit
MLFLVIMVAIIFLQIVSRTLIGSSFYWTEEMARFMMIWVIFLGAGFAFQYGAHISIESLVDRFSDGLKKTVQVLILLLSISFFLVMFVKGIELTSKTMVQLSPSLNIPMGYVYCVIPISAILQILNMIDVTIRFCRTGEAAREEI